jgi:hypothetical protein
MATRAKRLAAAAFLLVVSAGWAANLSDDDIRRILIQQSIAAYPGNCPCPYNLDRAGRSCGKRSAWSRAGGHSPLCYPSDVSDEMVAEYRARAGL